jgi:hypothetical protein
VPEPIIYVDRSAVREGQVEQVRSAIDGLVAFINEHVPQLLFYGFYLDEEVGRMTVIAVHPDVESLEFHMDVGGPAFREFTELIRLEAIEVYGSISEKALEQLRQKAADLGGARLTITPRHGGFSRFPGLDALS